MIAALALSEATATAYPRRAGRGANRTSRRSELRITSGHPLRILPA
jgi:hypothetical protein